MVPVSPHPYLHTVCENRSDLSDSSQHHGLQPARLLCPWNSPGKNTGVGSHSLLQGIFSTQGSNPGLLHCRQTVQLAILILDILLSLQQFLLVVLICLFLMTDSVELFMCIFAILISSLVKCLCLFFFKLSFLFNYY